MQIATLVSSHWHCKGREKTRRARHAPLVSRFLHKFAEVPVDDHKVNGQNVDQVQVFNALAYRFDNSLSTPLYFSAVETTRSTNLGATF